MMTGMGKDGAKAIKSIWQQGGITFAQDEATCVVFGMPKAAVEEGGIDDTIPLNEIPLRVLDLVKQTPN